MRKVLVGVMLVSAAGGVAACGGSEKKAQAAQSAPASSVVINREPVDLKPVDVVANVPKAPRFTLTLNEGKSGFKFRSTTLTENAKAKIDEMFTGDKFDLVNAKFEIEGYTDNLGSKELNHQVGLARAKAVKQYLVEQHEFPADSITVVSYGMENPVADNATPDGRAKNRRVVIKVVD